jgi:hypothetical protein
MHEKQSQQVSKTVIKQKKSIEISKKWSVERLVVLIDDDHDRLIIESSINQHTQQQDINPTQLSTVLHGLHHTNFNVTAALAGCLMSQRVRPPALLSCPSHSNRQTYASSNSTQSSNIAHTKNIRFHSVDARYHQSRPGHLLLPHCSPCLQGPPSEASHLQLHPPQRLILSISYHQRITINDTMMQNCCASPAR